MSNVVPAPARRASARIKTLRALGRFPHRYRRLRVVTQLLTLAVLVAVPLSGLARFDAWRGQHLALGRPSGGIMAAGAVMVAIFGFYVVTFILNAAMGRVFCGYGCPVGQTSRLGDGTEVASRKKGTAVVAWLQLAGYALVLSGAVLSWWVDPRVLWLGGSEASLAALGAWLLLAGLVVAHGRLFRWRFCRAYCPIGLYYSAVQVEHAFGVHFDPAACESCDMCVRACPVELDPKALQQPIEDIGGLALDGFPGAHHCLTCGDCVQACEYATQDKTELVPLRLSFSAQHKSAASNRNAAASESTPRDADGGRRESKAA